MSIRFADCVVDPQARELRRGGQLLPLSPQAFLLLTLLLETRPRPRPQRELRDALWPETHVGYTSLARVVTEVRKAIGDTARPPSMIRTVSRFGYAFAAPVVRETGPSGDDGDCVFVTGDREFVLPEGKTLIGRGSECLVRLQSTEVSRTHARVHVEGRTATIEDLGSKNGTWLNGRQPAGSVMLAEGDEVIIGPFRLVYQRRASTASTRTGAPPGGHGRVG